MTLKSSWLICTLVSAALLSLPGSSLAVDWDGDTSSLWEIGTNWVGDGAPGATDSAVFNGAGNSNTTIDLGAGQTIGSLVFDTSSAAGYTIGSGAAGSQTLTLGTTGNAITMNSTVANNQLINANLALTITRTVATPSSYYAVTNNSATNTLTLAGGISATTAGVKVLNVTGSGNTAISGAITSGSGNMSIFKTGSGTLTLSGGGTFSGNGITDGANLASSAVFREGTTILNGGAYNNSGGELIVGGVATHGGVGTNTTLQLDNGASLTNMSWLSIGRGNGNGSVTSNLTLNGSSSITATNMAAGFNAGNAGNISNGTVALNGTSILTITNTVNFAESAGSNFTMNINDSATFRQTANANQTRVGISNGAVGVINVNGGTATFERDFILGAGGTGSGRLVLNSGTVNVANGTERWLKLNDSASASTGQIDVNGGNLNLNTNTDIRFSTNVNASGTNVINLNAGAITGYTGNNNGVFSGGSVVDLNQASNQAGVNNTFNLNGGTLTIGQVITNNNNGTAAFNFNGGTLRAAAASNPLAPFPFFLELGGANQTANVRTGGAIIDSNGFNITIAQALLDGGGNGGLTKNGAGALTLSGANTYTGATTINAGTVALSGSGALASTGAVNVAASGTAFDISAISDSSTTIGSLAGASGSTVALGAKTLTVGNSSNTTFAGAITGTGSVTKQGSGTLTLTGTNTFSGTFLIGAGTASLGTTGSIANATMINVAAGAILDGSSLSGGLTLQGLTGTGTVKGNVTVNGNLTPGNSPGLLTFDSDLALGSSSNSIMEIAGTTRGTGYDAVDVGGLLTNEGTLTLSIDMAIANAVYDLFSFDTATGELLNVAFAGSAYSGTFNYNGTNLWEATSGGQTFVFDQQTGDLSVVPEPQTCILAGLGLIALLGRRTRRRSH